MKRIFTLCILSSLIFFNGCSKDFLKKYEDRIVGTWRIDDVNKIGFGGDTNNLPFRRGSFTFNDNGTLTYTNNNGAVYQGTWEIEKRTSGDAVVRTLHITAVDFNNQQVLSEFYDDMNFVGTDHFKTSIFKNAVTYVTHFMR